MSATFSTAYSFGPVELANLSTVYNSKKMDPLSWLLEEENIWISHVLPFLGPGNHLFLASVNHKCKKLYEHYFSTIPIENLPKLKHDGTAMPAIPVHLPLFGNRSPPEPKITTLALAHTLYSVAFANVHCLKIWCEGLPQEMKYLLHTEGKDLMSLVRSKGCPWDEETCENAAKRGQLEILKYLHKHGCPWDEGITCTAAMKGHLEVMKYLQMKGCTLDGITTTFAASGGELEGLKYLHENGCSWCGLDCALAANNGDLEMLKYLHENGCPWDFHTCDCAISRGYLEVLKYAHENGCPWAELNTAIDGGNKEVIQYCRENGCPGFDWTPPEEPFPDLFHDIS